MAEPTKFSAPRHFPHAMIEEIYAQPESLRRTIEQNVQDDLIFAKALAPVEDALFVSNRIIIAASGSSRHAGLAGEIMLEDMAGVAVDVEYASEYCYRSTHTGADAIVLLITQSGETADTIAAQREALLRGAKTIAICNVADSTVVREASAHLLTHAGPELAVPATKSFTAQLTVLYLLALVLTRKRGRMTSAVSHARVNALMEMANGIERSLPLWDELAAASAGAHRDGKGFLFLGRGVHYAIAREGALKLKEISHVHAEGLPTGELRHGSNALVDQNLTVMALATSDATDLDSVRRREKTIAVLEYVKSRGGKVIAIVTEGDSRISSLADEAILVPAAPELLIPLEEVVPLQLFAYHFGVMNGCDVDRPRNLVKAVMTE